MLNIIKSYKTCFCRYLRFLHHIIVHDFIMELNSYSVHTNIIDTLFVALKIDDLHIQKQL